MRARINDCDVIELQVLDIGKTLVPFFEWLDIDGAEGLAEAQGDGPVDATFNAIRALFAHDARLVLFSVGAVTEGTDAQARTTVRLEEGGKMVDGQGSDTDTIVASARAYVHALNKLLVKRARTEPVALSA